MYKIISWYLRHFPFPYRGWKYFRAFLQRTGLYEQQFVKKLHNNLLFHVCPADHIQQQIFWYGYYEKTSILCWEAWIQPGSVVLDIGANTGYYSMVAAARQADVFAFEPATTIRQELEANINLNPGLSIRPVSIALGHMDGTAPFYIAGPDNRGMSGFHQPENFSGLQEQVEMMKADTWALQENIPRADLVKIDTEGAEMDILQGMRQILQRDHPVLFIEVQPEHLERSGHRVDELFQFLEALQYDAYLPEAQLQLRKLARPAAADVIIFSPADKAIPASFRVHS